MQEKQVLRKWKESVFGIADPRYGMMITEHRDEIREKFYKPTNALRKQLKNQRNVMKEKNLIMAKTMREDLRFQTSLFYGCE
jgi:hypothetical protein